MLKLEPLTLKAEAGAIPISEANFLAYIYPELTDYWGDLSTLGYWQVPVTFKAPAVSCTWGENNFMETITLYGSRSMGKLKESGYHLEGQTSIKGKKVSAFTSSQLWQLPDGRLLETATIHCRMGK